jgi:hypothetical protein
MWFNTACPQALLLLSQVFLGFIQHGFRDAHHPSRQDPTLATLAAKEAIKIVISLVLLWRQNRQSNASVYVSVWNGEGDVLPLRNSRGDLSEEVDAATLLFDAGSSDHPVFPDAELEEPDMRNLQHGDEGSDSQSSWPTRQQIYPIFALAGLHALHQFTVSAHTSCHGSSMLIC